MNPNFPDRLLVQWQRLIFQADWAGLLRVDAYVAPCGARVLNRARRYEAVLKEKLDNNRRPILAKEPASVSRSKGSLDHPVRT